jgi:hypothetical protein
MEIEYAMEEGKIDVVILTRGFHEYSIRSCIHLILPWQA